MRISKRIDLAFKEARRKTHLTRPIIRRICRKYEIDIDYFYKVAEWGKDYLRKQKKKGVSLGA